MTAPEPHKNHDLYFVPGLRRGLLVLEAIADEKRALGVSELAKRLEITRSSVFRLVYTLRQMGFVEEVGTTKTFTLGPRVLNLGFSFLASQSIIEVAGPELELLRDRTNVSAHLAIRERRDVLYLSCVQTRSGFVSTLNVGARLPAHACPMGWILLSEISPRDLAELLAPEPFEQLTAQTPRTLPELMLRISAAVTEGCAISRAAVEPGGSSIAAPIRDRTGAIVAAIDISGPDSAFDLDSLQSRDIPEVLGAAERISTRLGFVRSAHVKVD